MDESGCPTVPPVADPAPCDPTTPDSSVTNLAVSECPADQSFQIEIDEPAAGVALLRVFAEVDMLTSPEVDQAVTQLTSTETEILVIDLEQVTFLGTSGLASLVQALTVCRQQAIELRLICSTPRSRRPLQLAGLIGLFDIHPTDSQVDPLR